MTVVSQRQGVCRNHSSRNFPEMQNESDDDRDDRYREIPEENSVQVLCLHLLRLWNQAKSTLLSFLREMGAYEALDGLARQLARRPFTAFGLSIAFLAIALPVLIVLGFALSTAAITVTGLVLIEGTLVTIVSVLLFSCLGAIFLILAFFGVIALASYFGFMHIYDLMNRTQTRSVLMNFINRERVQDNSQNR